MQKHLHWIPHNYAVGSTWNLRSLISHSLLLRKMEPQSIPTRALPKCSRKHGHTGIAEMQPQAYPHWHCRNAAASMPTQALPKCSRKHTHTGIAEMHSQAYPHRHCRNAATSMPTQALPKCSRKHTHTGIAEIQSHRRMPTRALPKCSRTGECLHRHCRSKWAEDLKPTERPEVADDTP